MNLCGNNYCMNCINCLSSFIAITFFILLLKCLYVNTIIYCDVFRVCIPFRHVLLTPVWCVWVLLTPTCHVFGFPWQIINDGSLDLMISCLFYSLCSLAATVHKSHINHSYNETRTSPSAFSGLSCHADWVSWADCSRWMLTANC
jgi:hypothetical protein